MATSNENPKKLLLSVREVAHALGVSERAVWKWSVSGQLPKPIKLGRLKKWRHCDIEAWLEAQAQAVQRCK